MHNKATTAASPVKPSKLFIKDEIYAASASDTVLFATDEMGDTVFIKEVDYLSENENFVVQDQSSKMASEATGKDLQPQYAATSLLQLSQTSNRSATAAEADQQLHLIEIPGQEEKFVLVTTDEDEQKLMPISQLSNFITTTTGVTAAVTSTQAGS